MCLDWGHAEWVGLWCADYTLMSVFITFLIVDLIDKIKQVYKVLRVILSALTILFRQTWKSATLRMNCQDLMKVDVCRRITRGLEYIGAFLSSGGFGDLSSTQTPHRLSHGYDFCPCRDVVWFVSNFIFISNDEKPNRKK